MSTQQPFLCVLAKNNPSALPNELIEQYEKRIFPLWEKKFNVHARVEQLPEQLPPSNGDALHIFRCDSADELKFDLAKLTLASEAAVLGGVKDLTDVKRTTEQVKELTMLSNREDASLAPVEEDPQEKLNKKLEKLINQQRVMLFMKGDKLTPFCKFSKIAVALLQKYLENDEWGGFNILDDEEVRQGLKVYSDWPTYPQLYVDGELMGGVDIMQEMDAEGELGKELGK